MVKYCDMLGTCNYIVSDRERNRTENTHATQQIILFIEC